MQTLLVNTRTNQYLSIFHTEQIIYCLHMINIIKIHRNTQIIMKITKIMFLIHGSHCPTAMVKLLNRNSL